jgi:hypothetical protein
MTTESSRLLVIRDDQGYYYLISDDAIEAARVPAEKRATVEEALQGDVSGFFDTAPPAENTLVGTIVTAPPKLVEELGLKAADADTK